MGGTPNNAFFLDRIDSIPFEKTPLGYTHLHLAALSGNLERLKAQLNERNIQEKSAKDETVLHLACWSGSLNIAQFLLENRDKFSIDPMAKTQLKRTPLHYACIKGHLHVAQFFLDNRDSLISNIMTKKQGIINKISQEAVERLNNSRIIDFMDKIVHNLNKGKEN